LALTEAIAGTVTVYKSDGVTVIKQWTGLGNGPTGVAIGDYDNDGLNDIAIVQNAGGGNMVTVYKSDGVTVIKHGLVSATQTVRLLVITATMV
jgi:hypothetical protein